MPQPRRRTEMFGFMTTIEESQVLKAYLQARGLSASQYLRQCALQPLLEAQAAADGQGDGERGQDRAR